MQMAAPSVPSSYKTTSRQNFLSEWPEPNKHHDCVNIHQIRVRPHFRQTWRTVRLEAEEDNECVLLTSLVALPRTCVLY